MHQGRTKYTFEIWPWVFPQCGNLTLFISGKRTLGITNIVSMGMGMGMGIGIGMGMYDCKGANSKYLKRHKDAAPEYIPTTPYP